MNGGSMTAKTERNDGDNIRSWAPQAIIYEHDSTSFEAYLVLEGEVEIFAPLGLKLNTIGQGEIFGEASLLLNAKRSVTARAGNMPVKVRKIPRSYFDQLQNKDLVMTALLKNVQLRLQDSNKQSSDLAKEIGQILKLVEMQVNTNKEVSTRLSTIHKRLNGEMIFGD